MYPCLRNLNPCGKRVQQAKALLKAVPHITKGGPSMCSKERGEAFHSLTFSANCFTLFLPLGQAKATNLVLALE